MKKTFLTLSFLLLFAGGVFADGPQSQNPELAKKQINECSDGITQAWTYSTMGHIFHGKNLDLECVETLKGVPSYDDEKDNFIFKDNLFWFFIDEESNGSSVKDTEYGVVAQHRMSTHRRNYLIKNVLTAQNQDEIETVGLVDGDYELHEDYYISKGSKGYITSKGGAFWYNTKRNYGNEIIELLDSKFPMKYGIECRSPEKIIESYGMTIEEIKEGINPKTGLSGWWLSALTYHKRPTWCYSK